MAKSLSEQMSEVFDKKVRAELKLWGKMGEAISALPDIEADISAEVELYMKESYHVLQASLLSQLIDICRDMEKKVLGTGVRHLFQIAKEGGMSPKNFFLCIEAVINFDTPYTINIQDIDYEESRQTTQR